MLIMLILRKLILSSALMGISFSMANFAFASEASPDLNKLGVKKIGILVPIALPAMDQIIAGYESELKKEYPGPIEFMVKNAQGNASIQQAILQEFLAQPVDVLAPIGTDATEMTIHMDQMSQKNIPIVAIAAEMPKGNKYSNVTNVLDEVSVAEQINFIHEALPNLKKLTLVYSADDRIFADVKQVNIAARKAGIQVQALMVQALPDLYAVKDHIAEDSQAIFILKDELVVSGIRTLVQQAEQRHIPVIASDDGSVANGAAFSLGVKESDIGKFAAISTAKILKGTPAGDIPQVLMSQYTVFMNEKSANLQGVDVKFIEKVGLKKGFSHDAISQ